VVGVRRGLDKAFKEERYRFTLVYSGTKRPKGNKWTTENVHAWDDPKIQECLDNGGNIGIHCGYRGLVVVDFDTEEAEKEICPLLPVTRTIRSAGKGRKHLHFFCNSLRKGWGIDHPTEKDENGKAIRIIDVLSEGKQALIPPSINSTTGRQYELINDIEPATITESELKAVFFKYQKEKGDNKINSENLPDLIPVLKQAGMDISRNPTKCLWHGSVGGKCFSFNDKVYHCFHCDESGNVVSFVKKHYNLNYLKACEKLGIKPITKLNFSQGRRFGVSDLDIAEEFIKSQPLFYDKKGLWWGWDLNNQIWLRIDETDILNGIDLETNLKDSTNASVKSSIMEALRRKARLYNPIEPPITWVQFGRDIVDIKTLTSYKTNPKVFMRNSIPWKVGVSDETPIIDDLLKSWVNEKDMFTLKEIMAYCLYRDYPIHRVFALIGAGRNGKSTYLNLIKKFIGIENFATTDLNNLLENRFESATLYLKLAGLMGECSEKTLTRTDMLKRLSGQDETRVELKGKMPFSCTNYAKLIMSMNALPMTMDNSLGFYSRWLIINFNKNTFVNERDVLGEVPGFELENLVCFCLKALQSLLSRGRFANEGDFKEREKTYEQFSNPIGRFILEKCEENCEGEILLDVFFEHLNAWLRKNNYRPFLNKEDVSKRLRRQNFEIQRLRVNDGRGRYLLGYKLKDIEEEINKKQQIKEEIVRVEQNVPVPPVPPVPLFPTQLPIYSSDSKIVGQPGQVGQNIPEFPTPSTPENPRILITGGYKYISNLIYKLDGGEGCSQDNLFKYLRAERIALDEDQLTSFLETMAKKGIIYRYKPDKWKRYD
jgi:P4 family phage/plasmid primase-like protien